MIILNTNSLEWMASNPESQDFIYASFPDAAELGIKDISEYKEWWFRAVRLTFETLTPTGALISTQTDRFANNRTYCKANWLAEVAQEYGADLVFHKIILLKSPGKVDWFRPTFTHFVGYGNLIRDKLPTIIDASPKVYPNSITIKGAEAIRDIAKLNNKKTIFDPFCGYGIALTLCEQVGIAATGIDISPEQCEKAKEYALQNSINATIFEKTS